MQLPILNDRRAANPNPEFDADALARDLAREVHGEVRFDIGSRALYSTDASNYRMVPTGVVIPRSTDAVVATLAVCARHGAPITSRGCGTGLAGQTCNSGVIIDHSKYLTNIIDIDPKARTARVQPGVVVDQLNRQIKGPHGLAWTADPATHEYCTFGGALGNNSCGVHAIMAGRTSDNVAGLEVITYDGHRMHLGPTSEESLAAQATGGRPGQIYAGIRDIRQRYASAIRERFPKIPRRVSGYNLDDLLPEKGCNTAASVVGSEGTLVCILEATLRLTPWPRHRTLVVLGYSSVFEAADHVVKIAEFGPMGLEGIDDLLVRYMHIKGVHPKDLDLLPDGKGWLLIEFGGETQGEADGKARAMVDAVCRGPAAPSHKLYDDPDEEHQVWQVRESGLAATAFVPSERDTWPGFEDSAVPPEQLGGYLREFRDLMKKYDYTVSVYGHFGQGCVHCRIPFDLVTRPGIDKYRRFIEEASDLVVRYGGTCSGEHGDGQARAVFLPKTFGPEVMDAFRAFKRLWDPQNKMNPGKVIDAFGPTDNLRLGTDYNPRGARTAFAYPEDHTFHHATLRCVSVGKCRRREDGFMCPTFRVLKEEKHTTRGRAHMLFEMTRGDFIKDGWRSREVHESLDLCIGCKGCKDECPVNVDMAKYKSEFLSHHYGWRPRPRAHYSMGLIGWWSALAGVAPGVANFVTHSRATKAASKWAAGVAPQRELPPFARQTFRAWFKARADPVQHVRGRVLLLPDLFNDAFYPDTLQAACMALEALGYEVLIPRGRFPATRPLLHYGMLSLARRTLGKAVRMLLPYANEGVPIVGLEPSTVSVFRDELMELLPGWADAVRVHESTKLFSEFLDQEDVQVPAVGGTAVVHLHCHEKAVLDAGATRRLLKRMKVEFVEPEPGCCGMAGSFGFETQHYDLSLQIGNQALIPAVRAAPQRTTLIAPGFSCRTQIEDATHRRPLHPAEFLWRALQSSGATADTAGGAEDRHAA